MNNFPKVLIFRPGTAENSAVGRADKEIWRVGGCTLFGVLATLSMASGCRFVETQKVASKFLSSVAEYKARRGRWDYLLCLKELSYVITNTDGFT